MYRKKVLLALSLAPAAALLLLPGFAVNPAQAACSGPYADGTWHCTNGTNQTITGPTTVTIPAGTSTTTNISAIYINPALAGNQGAGITVSDTKVYNYNQYGSPGNNIGINIATNVATSTGNLALTMTGNNYVETARGTSILVNNLGLGAAAIDISGTLRVKSTWTAVEGQDGVEATTHGGGAASITIHDLVNDGQPDANTITVNGGGNGILIESVPTGGAGTGGGNVTGNIGGGLTINVAEGSGVDGRDASMGTGNNGIRAVTQNAGTVTLTTAADIIVKGDYASGIFAGPHNYWNATHTTLTLGDLTGDVSVTNSGKITVDGSTSFGIEANTHTADGNAAGNVSVINSGVINSGTGTPGDSNDNSGGILAFSNTTGAGNTGTVSVTNSKAITVYGDNSEAIHAYTEAAGTGNASDVTVQNTGDIVSGNTAGQTNTGSVGIRAQSSATSGHESGAVSVTNSGKIVTEGSSTSAGIYAESLGLTGTVAVSNSGVITTQGAGNNDYGIFASAADDVEVINSGAVTTDGDSAHAIEAVSVAGAASVTNSGKLTTYGADANGILAATTPGTISIVNSSGGDILTTGAGANGIEADTRSGAISIANNAEVTSQQAVGVLAAATGASPLFKLNNQANGTILGATAGVRLSGNFASATITNAGTIGSLNDWAIDTSALTTAPVTINNTGTINGYMTLGAVAGNTLTNAGTWNLQNSNATTNKLAVADMGTSATVSNSGTINLLGNSSALPLDTTGQYLPLAAGTVTGGQVSNPYNAPASGGPVQGQILGVRTFYDMGGVIDLTKNQAAGDVLVISGGHTPGVDGGGVFVTGGGSVYLNTVLNEGAANAQSDILVVDSTQYGTAKTKLFIVPTGNSAQTIGNGIPVVEVLNKGASDSNAFVLGNAGGLVRVVNGLYEYDLWHNGVGADAADGNWYLRSMLDPTGNLAQRPEPYLYARNMAAATGMFMHTLHDRLGEPQFTGTYGGDKDNEQNNVPAVWGRISYSSAGSESAGGRMDLDTESTLVHIGGDIAHWSSGNNRFHLGLMGAYGRSNTDSEANDVRFTNNGLVRKASGNVEGYSFGVYGTWYGNDKQAVGPYIDLWAMYGWFDNTVQGNGLAREDYNSTAGTVSIEAGYAFMLYDGQKRQLMIEPQAQVAYTLYSQDDHVEANGTRVNNEDGDGITTRLGARLFLRGKEVANAVQPFVEGNWWHSTANNSLDFNGMMVEDGAPSSRYELKVGLQGELGKHWHAWAHVGGQWGADSYSRYEGMAGLKYVW